MDTTWMVIINPHAGKGRGLSDWPWISSLLTSNDLKFNHAITEKAGDAVSKIIGFIAEGYRKFIVVGGDGSLNEAVHGIFSQSAVSQKDIVLAHIPVGNGNDWGKTYENPTGYEESVQVILQNNSINQSVGRITYMSEKEEKQRYFLNIAGFGFDAMVVKDVQKMKEKGKSGQLIYFATLLKDLFKSNYIAAKIIVDEKMYEHKFLSVAVGICKYNGGGMMILPFSDPARGTFDVTMIKDLSKVGVIRNVLYLFSGTFVKNKKVTLARGKSIHIDSDVPFLVEADGEFLGESPVKLEIIPSALNVIVNSTNFEVNPQIREYAP